jgi:hypothetical protein
MRLVVLTCLLAVSAVGCSRMASIRTRNHRWISAEIKSSDQEALTVAVEGSSQDRRIPRAEITLIDHSGMVSVLAGTMGTIVGSGAVVAGSVALSSDGCVWGCGLGGIAALSIGIVVFVASAGAMSWGWTERARSKRASAGEHPPDTVDEPGVMGPRLSRGGAALLTW